MPSTAAAADADQSDDGGAVGKDADDVGAAPDFLVEPFLGIVDQIWRQICLGKAVNASSSARAASRWREGDDVFHTYSAYERGIEGLVNTYNFLDLTPLDRQIHIAEIAFHDSYAS